MQTWVRHHQLLIKALWSLVILFVFLLGKAIPLPYLNARQVIIAEGHLNSLSLVTGGDLSHLSIFSLGIGPWMAALIIFSFLAQNRRLKKVSSKRLDYCQRITTLVIAVVQAFVTVMGLTFNGENQLKARLINVLILVAGACLVMWLCNQNSRLGIGGAFFLMMVNILKTIWQTSIQTLTPLVGQPLKLTLVLIAALVFIVLFIALNVLLDRAERRIMIRRIMMESQYLNRSYLPVKLVPAGGMPVMYAMSLMMIPIYFNQFLRFLWPHNQFLARLNHMLTLTNPVGIVSYLLILLGLSFLFAYLSLDPQMQAEDFQHRGDYLPGQQPGRATEKYLQQVVSKCALFGGLYVVLFAGMPLLFIKQEEVALIPGELMMVVGLALIAVEQIRSLWIGKQYQTLL